MHKVWIEAALNGPWSRKFQPGIPDTVEAIIAEGVACARAGATIIHTHAYDGGGPQTHDWQVYARIIEGIRNQVDTPSIPPTRHSRRTGMPVLQTYPLDMPTSKRSSNAACSNSHSSTPAASISRPQRRHRPQSQPAPT